MSSYSQSTVTKDVPESQVSIKKVESKKDISSKENRKKLNYIFTAGAIGTNFGTGTNNYEFGYFYKPNRILGLQYQEFRNTTSILKQNESDYERNRKGHALLLSYKAFGQGSFYIKSSMYHRIQERVDKQEGEFKKVHYEDLCFLFSLGNQWQWKNFNLGIDWIGLSTVLGIINQEGDYKLENRDLAEWTLLNLYIGYAF